MGTPNPGFNLVLVLTTLTSRPEGIPFEILGGHPKQQLFAHKIGALDGCCPRNLLVGNEAFC